MTQHAFHVWSYHVSCIDSSQYDSHVWNFVFFCNENYDILEESQRNSFHDISTFQFQSKQVSGLRVNNIPVTDPKYVLTKKDLVGDSIKLSFGKKKHALLILKK